LNYGESEWSSIIQHGSNAYKPAHSIIDDKTPLPPQLDDPIADEEQFKNEPWIEAPIKVDYGFNVRLGEGVFVNFNCVFIDSCPITVGARTLFGPNVNLFAGMHPLDPALRNGTEGPEMGKPISIGEDCWIGGNVIVLPGVTIGKGVTIGAGSVVTKVCFLFFFMDLIRCEG
jgi:acetyltransferase-like isoleucine patch superfamily enzyme